MPIQIFLHQMTPEETETIRNLFSHHPPTGGKADRHKMLRASAIDMAAEIYAHVPVGRERSLAITNLQEVLMWANAGVACNPEITS